MFKFFKIAMLGFILSLTGVLNAQDVSNGRVLSRDLLTNDASKAAKFYSELFGWKISKKNKWISLSKDGKEIANIIEVDSKKQPIWIPLFAYDDLDKAKKVVLQNGGEILRDEHQEDGIGDYLLIRDQEKALLVLTNADSEYVKPGFPKLNEWLWDEIWTFDVDGSEKFYKKLFSYETEKYPSGYVVFKNKDEWLSGLLLNPFEKSRTQWGSTVKVDDPKAISEKALSLGGKILVSVDELIGHKNEAILADPTGAVFLVQKYEEQEQK